MHSDTAGSKMLCDMEVSVSSLSLLSRKELQEVAKKHGLKANLKSAAIIKTLTGQGAPQYTLSI